eukprot:6412050-Karenia_brevis.AAC.1
MRPVKSSKVFFPPWRQLLALWRQGMVVEVLSTSSQEMRIRIKIKMRMSAFNGAPGLSYSSRGSFEAKMQCDKGLAVDAEIDKSEEKNFQVGDLTISDENE